MRGNGKLLKARYVVTLGGSRRVIEGGAVVVSDSVILAVDRASVLEGRYPDARVIDFGDKLVMPGLINAHTHLYSALARGMPFTFEAPSNFVEILERVWWRLDKMLDRDLVYASTMAGLIDCIRHGTTTIIDHHASPFGCRGSLEAMALAVDGIGTRACLAYEVSDRDGPEIAAEGIEENRSFIEWCRQKKPDNLAASFGLHASFTLSDDTLAGCVEAAGGAGFHIHVAEDRADLEDAQSRYGKSVVQRLRDLGILGERTLAAHCIHIDEKDMDALAETGTQVIHNPQSNCNNAVGTSDVLGMAAKGITVGLGSDGFSANPLDELRAANILHKLIKKDPRVGTPEVCDFLFKNNPKICSLFFEKPLGVLEPGAFADMVVFDYRPPTPIHADNLIGHILFGIAGTPVDSVMVGGRMVLENGEFVDVDEAEILAKTSEAAKRLWEKL